MQRQWVKGLCILLVSTSLISSVVAKERTRDLSDSERIERLERLMESQGLVDLLLRLDSLQQEVQQLRGDNDVSTRSLENIKKRQRDLYIDIDRRLLQLERRVSGSSSVAPPAVSPSVDITPSSVSAKPTEIKRPQKQSSATNEVEAQKAYQKAFDLLRDLRYEQAISAFRHFLSQYPNSRYSHIAQYWLGEAGYARSQFAAAIKDYQALLDHHANSPKRPQAMLKIGYSYYKLKNIKAAKASFEKVVKTYPGTTEAGQAQKMLKDLKLKRN